MNYEVHFLYNARGRAAVEHVVRCSLPDGIGPDFLLSAGFWIDDTELLKDICADAVWAGMTGARRMWVPPGRITSVLPMSESGK